MHLIIRSRITWLLIVLLFACTNPKYDEYTEISKPPSQFNESSIDRYLLTQYKAIDVEQISVLYFKNNIYIDDEMSTDGSRYNVSKPIWEIVMQCSRKNCNQVIFAHNHVGCYFAKPSTVDTNTTALLKKNLSIVNITLIAHVVVADHDTFWIR